MANKYEDEVYKKIGNTIREIHRVVMDTYKEHPSEGCFSSNRINQNPYTGLQTDHPQKFILREYYGSPGYLQTAIGEVSLTGSTYSDSREGRKAFWKSLKEKLGLVLIEEGDYEGGSYINKDGYRVPKDKYTTGFFGGWWQVTKCGDRPILTTRNAVRRNNYKKQEELLTYKEVDEMYTKYVRRNV